MQPTPIAPTPIEPTVINSLDDRGHYHPVMCPYCHKPLTARVPPPGHPKVASFYQYATCMTRGCQNNGAPYHLLKPKGIWAYVIGRYPGGSIWAIPVALALLAVVGTGAWLFSDWWMSDAVPNWRMSDAVPNVVQVSNVYDGTYKVTYTIHVDNYGPTGMTGEGESKIMVSGGAITAGPLSGTVSSMGNFSGTWKGNGSGIPNIPVRGSFSTLSNFTMSGKTTGANVVITLKKAS